MQNRLSRFIAWHTAHKGLGKAGWLRKLFRVAARPSSEPSLPSSALDTSEDPEWVTVANIVALRQYGPGGSKTKSGTKQLSPGGKVYVFASFAGSPGTVVTVVGRHRASKRYITLHMSAEHLTNWRAELLYSPHVLRQIRAYGWFASPAPSPDEARARAEGFVKQYSKVEL
jgi:hypothetical protein